MLASLTITKTLLSECHAVINKKTVILAARIADAIADVQQPALRQRERKPRCHVAEAVFAAKPIGNEAGAARDCLLVAEHRAAFVNVGLDAAKAIAAGGQARPEAP